MTSRRSYSFLEIRKRKSKAARRCEGLEEGILTDWSRQSKESSPRWQARVTLALVRSWDVVEPRNDVTCEVNNQTERISCGENRNLMAIRC
jgi:hypothetical protein